jgi:membrane protein
VVVVGDSPYDVKAAKKLGISVIGFRSGGFDDRVLIEAGADELYDGVEDLLRQYEKSLISGLQPVK